MTPRTISAAHTEKTQVSLRLVLSAACIVSVKVAEEYFQQSPRTFSVRFSVVVNFTDLAQRSVVMNPTEFRDFRKCVGAFRTRELVVH